MRTHFSQGLTGMVLLLLAGCGSRYGVDTEMIETVPVNGSVTYNGKPLENYQVTFTPADGRRPAMGVTDAAGKFTLGTNQSDDGAPPGLNRISVTWAGPESNVDPSLAPAIDDPSKMPKPPVELPEKYQSPETSGLSEEVPEDGLADYKIELQ